MSPIRKDLNNQHKNMYNFTWTYTLNSLSGVDTWSVGHLPGSDLVVIIISLNFPWSSSKPMVYHTELTLPFRKLASSNLHDMVSQFMPQ